MPATRGTSGPEVMPDIGLPWELYNWQQLEWYGKVNFLKGGLVFADSVDHGEPDAGAASCARPAGGFGLHDVFIALGDRLVGIAERHRPADLGSGDRHPDHRAVLRRAARGQAALQGGAAALVRAAAAADERRSSA